MLLVFVEQYCSDRFYGRFISSGIYSRVFYKTFPFGGFSFCITNLTLVNFIFFLRDDSCLEIFIAFTYFCMIIIV